MIFLMNVEVERKEEKKKKERKKRRHEEERNEIYNKMEK